MSIVLNISAEFAGLVRGVGTGLVRCVDELVASGVVVKPAAAHPAMRVPKSTPVAALNTDHPMCIRTLLTRPRGYGQKSKLSRPSVQA